MIFFERRVFPRAAHQHASLFWEDAWVPEFSHKKVVSESRAQYYFSSLGKFPWPLYQGQTHGNGKKGIPAGIRCRSVSHAVP